MIPKYIWELSIVLISSFSSKVIKYSNIFIIFWSFLPWDVLAQLSAPPRLPARQVPVVRTALGWHLDRHLAWSPLEDWKLKNPGLGDHLSIYSSLHHKRWIVITGTSFEVMLEKASNWDLLLPISRLAPAWIIGNTHIKFLYLFKNCISFSKMKKAPFWLQWKNSETVQPTHPFHPWHLTLLALKVLLEPSWFDRKSFLHQWNSPLAGATSGNWLTGWEYHYWY